MTAYHLAKPRIFLQFSNTLINMKYELFIIGLLGLLAAIVSQFQGAGAVEFLPSMTTFPSRLRRNPGMGPNREQFRAGLRAIHCVQARLLVNNGIMTDSKVNMEKLEELLQTADYQEGAQAFLLGVKDCQSVAETGDNECTVVENYAKCLAHRMHNQ